MHALQPVVVAPSCCTRGWWCIAGALAKEAGHLLVAVARAAGAGSANVAGIAGVAGAAPAAAVV
eukprot:361975-Chlamydomonas_euryale.AAC.6